MSIVRDFLRVTKQEQLADLDKVIAGHNDHKFQSHERLFRLSLNVNTLALTAWIGLATWKSEQFEISRLMVMRACGLHILSWLVMALADLLIMLQSRSGALSGGIAKAHWLIGLTNSEGAILGKEAEGRNSPEQLMKMFYNDIDSIGQNLESSSIYIRNHNRAVKYGMWSWWVGILGLMLFFGAITLSVFSMANFLHAAKVSAEPKAAVSLQASPAPSAPVSKTPSNGPVKYQ